MKEENPVKGRFFQLMESDAMIILTIGIIWSKFFFIENNLRQQYKYGGFRRKLTSVLGVSAITKLLSSTMIVMKTTKVMERYTPIIKNIKDITVSGGY